MAEQGKFGHALYRLTRSVHATEIDDLDNSVGRSRELPAGTELHVVRDRHAWQNRQGNQLFYTVEVGERRFRVAAEELESAILRVLDQI